MNYICKWIRSTVAAYDNLELEVFSSMFKSSSNKLIDKGKILYLSSFILSHKDFEFFSWNGKMIAKYLHKLYSTLIYIKIEINEVF